MFWKIFAWINIIINVPLLVASLTSGIFEFNLLNVVILALNDLPLLLVPLLFSYKKFNLRMLSNIIILKSSLFFIIIYNITNFYKGFSVYNFTSAPGFIFDLSFVILVPFSILAFMLYIMCKFKITFWQVFTKQ